MNYECSEELYMKFKELSEAFVNFMIWLFTILAVRATDTGNALLVKHNGFMMAAVLASFLNLLVFILAIVLQLENETRSLIVEIALGSSVLILASFVISSAIGWLTWACTSVSLQLLLLWSWRPRQIDFPCGWMQSQRLIKLEWCWIWLCIVVTVLCLKFDAVCDCY